MNIKLPELTDKQIIAIRGLETAKIKGVIIKTLQECEDTPVDITSVLLNALATMAVKKDQEPV